MPHREVLLVNPNRMRPPIAPIGLEYIGAALTRGGYAAYFCDLTFAEDWRAALLDAIAALDPTAVLFSVRNLDDAYFASQDFVLEVTAQMVRTTSEATDAPIILGGVGFSCAPCETLRYTGAHYGIVGDGETALPLLLECLAHHGDPAAVPGAVFRSEDGYAVCPPDWLDLNNLPAPPRRLADNPRYFAEGGQAGIETKRGCACTCIYCLEPNAKGKLLRTRSAESVVTEILDLLEQGIDCYHLCDSEFNLPASHAHAVCQAIVGRGVAQRIRWYTYASPQGFDEGLARAMAQAGCAGINFGVDHADTGMLRRLGRAFGPDALRQTVEACRAAGLAVMFDMLLGGPGETRASIACAIDEIRKLAPDRAGLSCGVRIYPHTPLAQLLRCQGPIASNPHLHGVRAGNDDFLKPIFYVDAGMDGDIHTIAGEYVGGDPLFFHADPSQLAGNYNYNDNSVLSNAIRAGERGAYWDILRRLAER